MDLVELPGMFNERKKWEGGNMHELVAATADTCPQLVGRIPSWPSSVMDALSFERTFKLPFSLCGSGRERLAFGGEGSGIQS